MIVKQIEKPVTLLKTEALLRRLPIRDPARPEIEQELVKGLAGYKGERALAYYLNFLPQKNCLIFHNLRLPSGNYHFQIDFLILTTTFTLIIECKNFYGTLFFDDAFKQLIRNANNLEECFPDPISQAKWHRIQLTAWLKKHHFPSHPIDYLVVFSNPSTILKTDANNKEAREHIIHSQIFIERYTHLAERYQQYHLDDKMLRKLSKTLMKSHVPEVRDVLKKYGISKSDLITGVRCPECKSFKMVREKRKWFCPTCGCFDKNAHQEALEDYFSLLGPTMTNQQCREFLQLSSIHTATRILNSMNLSYSGTKKGRIYFQK